MHYRLLFLFFMLPITNTHAGWVQGSFPTNPYTLALFRHSDNQNLTVSISDAIISINEVSTNNQYLICNKLEWNRLHNKSTYSKMLIPQEVQNKALQRYDLDDNKKKFLRSHLISFWEDQLYLSCCKNWLLDFE